MFFFIQRKNMKLSGSGSEEDLGGPDILYKNLKIKYKM